MGQTGRSDGGEKRHRPATAAQYRGQTGTAVSEDTCRDPTTEPVVPEDPSTDLFVGSVIPFGPVGKLLIRYVLELTEFLDVFLESVSHPLGSMAKAYAVCTPP